MSVTELSGPRVSAGAERSLTGWGRTAYSRCRVTAPSGADEILELMGSPLAARQGVIARGAGRSYGDAAQNEGGEVLDMTGMNAVVSIDRERRLVTAQAGATVARLMAALAPHRLTLPVVPGTSQVTLAGAIASDVHGKNHHRDGAFARHVREIVLCTPAGELLRVTPEEDAELFYATLGGMGLTGVVLEATVAAQELPVPLVLADLDRTDGLEATLEMLSGRERHRYSVAWLDLLARGSRMGRAVVSRADPLGSEGEPGAYGRDPDSDTDTDSGYPERLLRGPLLDAPGGLPGSPLSPARMRAFNSLYWRASPRRVRGRRVRLAPFFFPLDAIGEWNRLYGHAGLIQYQFVVPSGRELELERCFEVIRSRRVPVYLAVFKRFGEEFGGPLSFPLEGWTLAIDVPAAAPGLAAALSELDSLVVGCGGRVYLSKDVRLEAEMLAPMYPRLEHFRRLRERVDPLGVLRSDLGRRLGLCGGVA
jgi:decaprenylphospho-beta-D-ribofuranose 2-oxidase